MYKKRQRNTSFRKNIIRSITALLVGLVVAGSTYGLTPRTTHALGGDWAVFAKEMSDAIAWIFGDLMIAAISGQTYEWSMEGFGGLTVSVDPTSLEPIKGFLDGDTTFLTDPEKFFSSIGDEITTFFLSEIDTLANEGIISDGEELSIIDGIIDAVAIAARDGNESSASRLVTTIDTDQLRSFMKGNFSGEGGWSTWIELTNNPQNYFDGSMQIAISELNRAKNAAVERSKEELAQSGGFLSLRQCQTLDDLGIVDPQLRRHAKVDERGCAGYQNVTPGGLVGDKVKSAISADLERMGATDEITEIIAALVTTAIDQLVQKGFSEITKVTRNFGTPSSVEEAGTSAVDEIMNLVNSEYVDIGKIDPPPPANPTDGTEWPSTSIPQITSIDRGDNWVQVGWDRPSGVSEDDIEGYILYRFEDRTRTETRAVDNNRTSVVVAPNGVRDEDEVLSVIAVMNKGSDTLYPGVDLVYVDSDVERTKQYGYAVVAYDTHNNRSSRPEDAAIQIAAARAPLGQGESPDPRVDISPILTLIELVKTDEKLVLPSGKSVNANLYEAEVGAYWVDENGDAPSFSPPRFDVLVNSTLTNMRVPEGQQWVISYGLGAKRNGEKEKIQFLVPNESSDDQIQAQVNLKVQVDIADKVKELSGFENNNSKTIKVYFDPERNGLELETE